MMAGIPVQPDEIYEALGNLAIFGGLSLFYRHKRFDGQVWWLYVLSYGALRLGWNSSAAITTPSILVG